MRTALPIMLGALFAAQVGAQSPSANQSPAVQQAQIRASAAYRELTEAQFQLKLAEQDYLNTQDAYHAATKSAENIKRELDKMKKALDAAKIRETQARKDYEAALGGVDKVWDKPPAGR